MNTTNLKKLLMCGGPDAQLAWIKFTPAGTGAPTVQESHLISPVVSRTSAGLYVVSLGTLALKAMCVLGLRAISGDANYHELVHAESVANKTITITHRTIAYATIVSAGPAVSDTVGQISLAVLCRVGS